MRYTFLPPNWIHPLGPPYLLWILFSVTMVMGAPFGLFGGVLGRRLTKEPQVWSWTRHGVDIVLGGLWWTLSAVMPPIGFPHTFVRSFGGAFLIALAYECCMMFAHRLAMAAKR